MVSSASKYTLVKHIISSFSLSERRSCHLVGLSRHAYRYATQDKEDSQLRSRILELVAKYPRKGYLMLYALLEKARL